MRQPSCVKDVYENKLNPMEFVRTMDLVYSFLNWYAVLNSQKTAVQPQFKSFEGGTLLVNLAYDYIFECYRILPWDTRVPMPMFAEDFSPYSTIVEFVENFVKYKYARKIREVQKWNLITCNR